ncbi:Nn.00g061650.m01.CDS01 [Neocucurbitaria sp. VM-36]
MHTSLPTTWLALSAAAAFLPTATAFYPYHYASSADSTPASDSSSRLRRTPLQVSNSQPITLPLRRVPTPLRPRQNVHNIVDSNDPKQENSVAIDQDGGDLSYMVAVTFGDSKEEYHLLLDTAAGSTWVMSEECSSDACKTHSRFGEGDSGSLKTDTTPFSITYGTGSVSGSLASDTLHIGALSSPLTFGLATTVSSEFRAYPMDGILGLGRSSSQSTTTSSDTPQVMDVLSTANLLSAKLYGIHLSRSKDNLADGELNLGAVNKARFSGDLNYLDTLDNDTGFWEIPLSSASVDGAAITLSGGTRSAIIDTGTSFILMPPADASALHAAVPNAQANSKDKQTFSVPCDTSARLAFTFGNTAYNISSADWVGGKVSESEGMCRSNVIGLQTFGATQWLVGDVFLKNVYSVFDFERGSVGFGVKSGDGDGEASAESASESSSSTGSATSSASGGVRETGTMTAGASPTSSVGAAEGTGGSAGRTASSLLGLSTVVFTILSLFI